MRATAIAEVLKAKRGSPVNIYLDSFVVQLARASCEVQAGTLKVSAVTQRSKKPNYQLLCLSWELLTTCHLGKFWPTRSTGGAMDINSTITSYIS